MPFLMPDTLRFSLFLRYAMLTPFFMLACRYATRSAITLYASFLRYVVDDAYT